MYVRMYAFIDVRIYVCMCVCMYVLQSAFCCRSSGGVSSVLRFSRTHDSHLYGRPLLSLCCGFGEGQVRSPLSTRKLLDASFFNGFSTFYPKDPSGLLAASWVSLGAFWVPLGAS